MADKIQIKRSTVADKKPTPEQLAEGELALNLQDEKIYAKNADGVVKEFPKAASVDVGVESVNDITGEVDINGSDNVSVTKSGQNLTLDVKDTVALKTDVPAQVNLIEGDGIEITGTYPNQTITNEVTDLGDLSSVTIDGNAGIADDSVLTWNGTAWVPGTGGGSSDVENLPDLGDVTFPTNPVTGEILQYTDGQWKNVDVSAATGRTTLNTLGGAVTIKGTAPITVESPDPNDDNEIVIGYSGTSGGKETLAELTDTTIATPEEDQFLRWSGETATGKWVNETVTLSSAPDDAQKNVQSDWNATEGDALILNKPTLAPGDAEKNVQSDWNESTTSADAYIKNKPTIPTNTDTGIVKLTHGELSVTGGADREVTFKSSDASVQFALNASNEIDFTVPLAGLNIKGVVQYALPQTQADGRITVNGTEYEVLWDPATYLDDVQSGVVGAALGDLWIIQYQGSAIDEGTVPDGNGYVYSLDENGVAEWSLVGPIQGPPGEDGSSNLPISSTDGTVVLASPSANTFAISTNSVDNRLAVNGRGMVGVGNAGTNSICLYVNSVPTNAAGLSGITCIPEIVTADAEEVSAVKTQANLGADVAADFFNHFITGSSTGTGTAATMNGVRIIDTSLTGTTKNVAFSTNLPADSEKNFSIETGTAPSVFAGQVQTDTITTKDAATADGKIKLSGTGVELYSNYSNWDTSFKLQGNSLQYRIGANASDNKIFLPNPAYIEDVDSRPDDYDPATPKSVQHLQQYYYGLGWTSATVQDVGAGGTTFDYQVGALVTIARKQNSLICYGTDKTESAAVLATCDGTNKNARISIDGQARVTFTEDDIQAFAGYDPKTDTSLITKSWAAANTRLPAFGDDAGGNDFRVEYLDRNHNAEGVQEIDPANPSCVRLGVFGGLETSGVTRAGAFLVDGLGRLIASQTGYNSNQKPSRSMQFGVYSATDIGNTRTGVALRGYHYGDVPEGSTQQAISYSYGFYSSPNYEDLKATTAIDFIAIGPSGSLDPETGESLTNGNVQTAIGFEIPSNFGSYIKHPLGGNPITQGFRSDLALEVDKNQYAIFINGTAPSRFNSNIQLTANSAITTAVDTDAKLTIGGGTVKISDAVYTGLILENEASGSVMGFRAAGDNTYYVGMSDIYGFQVLDTDSQTPLITHKAGDHCFYKGNSTDKMLQIQDDRIRADAGYEPSDDADLATKKYIDGKISAINSGFPVESEPDGNVQLLADDVTSTFEVTTSKIGRLYVNNTDIKAAGTYAPQTNESLVTVKYVSDYIANLTPDPEYPTPPGGSDGGLTWEQITNDKSLWISAVYPCKKTGRFSIIGYKDMDGSSIEPNTSNVSTTYGVGNLNVVCYHSLDGRNWTEGFVGGNWQYSWNNRQSNGIGTAYMPTFANAYGRFCDGPEQIFAGNAYTTTGTSWQGFNLDGASGSGTSGKYVGTYVSIYFEADIQSFSKTLISSNGTEWQFENYETGWPEGPAWITSRQYVIRDLASGVAEVIGGQCQAWPTTWDALESGYSTTSGSGEQNQPIRCISPKVYYDVKFPPNSNNQVDRYFYRPIQDFFGWTPSTSRSYTEDFERFYWQIKDAAAHPDGKRVLLIDAEDNQLLWLVAGRTTLTAPPDCWGETALLVGWDAVLERFVAVFSDFVLFLRPPASLADSVTQPQYPVSPPIYDGSGVQRDPPSYTSGDNLYGQRETFTLPKQGNWTQLSITKTTDLGTGKEGSVYVIMDETGGTLRYDTTQGEITNLDWPYSAKGGTWEDLGVQSPSIFSKDPMLAGVNGRFLVGGGTDVNGVDKWANGEQGTDYDVPSAVFPVGGVQFPDECTEDYRYSYSEGVVPATTGTTTGDVNLTNPEDPGFFTAVEREEGRKSTAPRALLKTQEDANQYFAEEIAENAGLATDAMGVGVAAMAAASSNSQAILEKTTVVTLTQAEYDALGADVKPDVLYLITV